MSTQNPIAPGEQITISDSPAEIMGQALHLLYLTERQILLLYGLSTLAEIETLPREEKDTLNQILSMLKTGTGWIQLAGTNAATDLRRKEEVLHVKLERNCGEKDAAI